MHEVVDTGEQQPLAAAQPADDRVIERTGIRLVPSTARAARSMTRWLFAIRATSVRPVGAGGPGTPGTTAARPAANGPTRPARRPSTALRGRGRVADRLGDVPVALAAGIAKPSSGSAETTSARARPVASSCGTVRGADRRRCARRISRRTLRNCPLVDAPPRGDDVGRVRFKGRAHARSASPVAARHLGRLGPAAQPPHRRRSRRAGPSASIPNASRQPTVGRVEQADAEDRDGREQEPDASWSESADPAVPGGASSRDRGRELGGVGDHRDAPHERDERGRRPAAHRKRARRRSRRCPDWAIAAIVSVVRPRRSARRPATTQPMPPAATTDERASAGAAGSVDAGRREAGRDEQPAPRSTSRRAPTCGRGSRGSRAGPTARERRARRSQAEPGRRRISSGPGRGREPTTIAPPTTATTLAATTSRASRAPAIAPTARNRCGRAEPSVRAPIEHPDRQARDPGGTSRRASSARPGRRPAMPAPVRTRNGTARGRSLATKREAEVGRRPPRAPRPRTAAARETSAAAVRGEPERADRESELDRDRQQRQARAGRVAIPRASSGATADGAEPRGDREQHRRRRGPQRCAPASAGSLPSCTGHVTSGSIV